MGRNLRIHKKEKRKHKASTVREAWRWTRQTADNTATSEFSARATPEERRKMASGKWFYSRAHLTVQGGAGAARRPGKRASRKSWCFRPEQQDVKQTNKQTHSQERYQKPTAADDIISMASLSWVCPFAALPFHLLLPGPISSHCPYDPALSFLSSLLFRHHFFTSSEYIYFFLLSHNRFSLAFPSK